MPHLALLSLADVLQTAMLATPLTIFANAAAKTIGGILSASIQRRAVELDTLRDRDDGDKGVGHLTHRAAEAPMIT